MGADAAIEERIRAHLDDGDLRGAATEAVRGYGPGVLGYLRAVLGDSDGDEAFSIYCESLWKQLPGFRGESAFHTWSYRIAWGAAQRVIGDPRRARNRRLETSQMEAIAQEVRSTTAMHLRAETPAHVQKLRNRLDPEDRTLLVLRVDRDLPWSEVASIVGTREATLRKRYERIKVRLRELAEAEGLLGTRRPPTRS